jgi:UDP-N-acetylglucosamine 1-carboxyvinyltransferase
MASFKIEGGRLLSGTITPQGAKNEALQVICATLLTNEKVTISNIPDIRDVNNLIQLLKDIGVKVKSVQKNAFSFQADELDLNYLESDEFVHKCAELRGSVMMIGPLLARMGKAIVTKPGGDKIGRRRLDTHFLGFAKLGAKFHHIEHRNVYEIAAPKSAKVKGQSAKFKSQSARLKGAYMLLDEASVTGTANIIMAAVLAEGTTTIYNAACEPYVQQLCHMLNNMGANINGIGSNLLTIVGVESLHGTEHRLLPDMIEVGSFIGMAAMCGDGVRIKDVSIKDLGIIPDAFRRLGVKMEIDGDDLFIPRQKHYVVDSFIDGTIMTLADAPWPGLTPDLLSVLIVVATQARGSVLIHQKMFESRLFFVDKLIDMGAQIILCDPHRAVVVGHDRKVTLRGQRMSSPDIRAGIALLIAAMSANGTSTISNIEQIDRGYQDIEGRLNALGAKIERI